MNVSAAGASGELLGVWIGVWLGVQLGHAVDARLLRRGVGVLCVLVGAALLFRDLVLPALVLPAL